MTQPTPNNDNAIVSIEPGARVWIGGHNREARRFIERALAGKNAIRPAEGPIDVAFITPETVDEAVYFLAKLAPRVPVDGVIQIVFRAHPAADSDAEPSRSFVNELTERIDRTGWRIAGPARRVEAFLCVRALRHSD